MASPIDTIVNINISASNPVVPQAGFGIPLILGSAATAVSAGQISYFTSAKGYTDAGGSTSDSEYKGLVSAFSQALSPVQVGVGTRNSAVAQVDTITPTAQSSYTYAGTLNGLAWTFTAGMSPTLTQVIDGIKAAIDALSQPVTTVDVGPGTDLTITATNAGQAFTTTLNSTAHMTLSHTTPNHGVAEDLTAIQLIDDTWYGLAMTSTSDVDNEAAAAYIEAQKKIFVGTSNTSDIWSSSATDIASVMHGKAYKRSALLATNTGGNLALVPGAAWLGGMLPYAPGSATWKFKQLVGISPDTWTASQRTFMIGVLGTSVGKNVNIYEKVGGTPITEEGWMIGGQFIDTTIGVDWLESTMQTNVFAALVEAAKVPYTNLGVGIILTAIWQTLGTAATRGFLDPTVKPTVSAPLVSAQSVPNRSARYFPDITFTAQGAGALHGVGIQGTVSV